MPYCDPLEIRELASGVTPTSQPVAYSNPLLEALIERASRYFDLCCGVAPGYFEPAASDAEASNKVIYGDGRQFLRLPPYVPGSLNATLTYPSGYTALNFIERDGYLVQTSTDGVTAPFLYYGSGWYGGVPITVSAIWGYESTPDDVKMAVVELTINLLRETDPAMVKLVNIEGQPLREKLPPRVAEIAKRYRMKGAAFV